jgi:hypothetical protein
MPPSSGKSILSSALSIDLLPTSGPETVLIHHRQKCLDLEINTFLVAVSSKILTRIELVSVYIYIYIPLALQPQFGPWPTSMKLSVSLRFTRS